MSFIGLFNSLMITLQVYLCFNISLVYMPCIIFVNIVVFMGMMVFISWVPSVKLTMKMKYYIEKYNLSLTSEFSENSDEIN